jgi:hypothetical protein
MKHVTYADKSLLIGDAAADLLVQYAAALGSAGQSDSVSVHAISSDGDEVDAMFLLGEGAPLMNETTTSTLPEPENGAVEIYMRERIDRLTQPVQGQPLLPPGDVFVEDFDEFQQ